MSHYFFLTGLGGEGWKIFTCKHFFICGSYCKHFFCLRLLFLLAYNFFQWLQPPQTIYFKIFQNFLMIFARHTYYPVTGNWTMGNFDFQDMPIIEVIRPQQPRIEVGGAKLRSHFHWPPLNWLWSRQNLSNSKREPRCNMPPARRLDLRALFPA